MSRKTIGYVVSILGIILTLAQEQLGLNINPTVIAAGVGSVLTYLFFEAKLDLKVLATQPGKWKDPKFWLTVVSALLTAVEATFALGIPVAPIVGVLTAIVGMLFGAKFKKAKAY